jgi:tetratricopeptide (TPR) repeat protein
VTSPRPSPVRVEKALALLPELEILGPLRALLISLSSPDESARWSSSGPYLTVGKRGIDVERLRARLPATLAAIGDHVARLYAAYLDALDLAPTDGAQAVAVLLRAGRLEEEAERLSQAEAWYDVALALSQPLADRRAEIDALGALGHLGLAQSRYADAARHFQRALALAEAVFDREAAIAACEGLGDATFAQGQTSGARAWYGRGLRVAEASTDRLLSGRLERRFGALAATQGDFSAATDYLSRARARFESDGPAVEMARVLVEQGRLEARLSRPSAAAASFQEALAWVRSPPPDVAMEIAIRVEIATLAIDSSRWLDAEEALRDAEQAALVAKRWRDLVRIYMLLGKLRGCQLDETGFVFFEQALEVCHVLQAASPIEAEVHLEYGVFRRRLGPADEARAHLERARDLFQLTGEVPARDRAEGELRQLSA